jgi:hypothetical protein
MAGRSIRPALFPGTRLPFGPGPAARLAEDVNDAVGEAAAPAGVVVPAAELPVGHIVACRHQHVVKGAGVVEEIAFFGARVEE